MSNLNKNTKSELNHENIRTVMCVSLCTTVIRNTAQNVQSLISLVIFYPNLQKITIAPMLSILLEGRGILIYLISVADSVVITKYPTTPCMHCYNTLQNILIKKIATHKNLVKQTATQDSAAQSSC